MIRRIIYDCLVMAAAVAIVGFVVWAAIQYPY